MQKKLTTILAELRAHAPFTLFGAFTGIILMVLFRNLEGQISYRLFYVFHPAHVVLSAMVTASMFELHFTHTVSGRMAIGHACSRPCS